MRLWSHGSFLQRGLFGDRERKHHRLQYFLVALVTFVVTVGTYAAGVMGADGLGVTVDPGDAIIIGGAAAAVVGYCRGGLVFGWLAVVAALLGWSVDFFVLTPLAPRVDMALSMQWPLFIGAVALLVGSIVVAVGWLARGTAGALDNRTR